MSLRHVLEQRIDECHGAGQVEVCRIIESAYELDSFAINIPYCVGAGDMARRGRREGESTIISFTARTVSTVILSGTCGRTISSQGLASQLAAGRHSTRPAEELAVAETFSACRLALVTVRIGAVAAKPLAAAVVARLSGRVGAVGHQTRSAGWPGWRIAGEGSCASRAAQRRMEPRRPGAPVDCEPWAGRQ
jgi:hypothetical protein